MTEQNVLRVLLKCRYIKTSLELATNRLLSLTWTRFSSLLKAIVQQSPLSSAPLHFPCLLDSLPSSCKHVTLIFKKYSWLTPFPSSATTQFLFFLWQRNSTCAWLLPSTWSLNKAKSKTPVTSMVQNQWWILSPHLSWPFSSIWHRWSLSSEILPHLPPKTPHPTDFSPTSLATLSHSSVTSWSWFPNTRELKGSLWNHLFSVFSFLLLTLGTQWLLPRSWLC